MKKPFNPFDRSGYPDREKLELYAVHKGRKGATVKKDMP